MSSGAHDHPEYATQAALDALAKKLDDHIAATPVPPDPPDLPDPLVQPFVVGVVLVQNESTAGYARSKDLPVRGQHYSAFGSNAGTSTNPATDAGAFVDKSQAQELYDAIAPQALDVHNAAYAGKDSRCKDTPEVQKMAQLALDLAATRPFVTMMNFWNELKGYYTSGTPGGWDADRFCRDYITWATAIRAKRPDIRLGGPYTTGQNGQNEVGGLDERVRYIHQTFIDKVVKPHPELVDYICWDHGDGTKYGAYTAFYRGQGINLPHVDTEWYPLPTTAAKIALDMSCDPMMARVMFWGSGTDAYMKAPLWNSAGTPTATLTTMITVNGFTAHRPVVKNADGTYTNAAGQKATLSGSTVTVS